MAVRSTFYILAAFRVFSNVPGRPPVVALGLVILEQVWLPPEVLPVMGIHSVCLMMVLPEGAPFSLEVVNIKIDIFRQLMDQLDLDFLIYSEQKINNCHIHTLQGCARKCLRT